MKDWIIHPELAFVRCCTSGGDIMTEHVEPGACGACGKGDADTGSPGERWVVRAYLHGECANDKPRRLPGKHLICQECLILWDE